LQSDQARMPSRYSDRSHAGRCLASLLAGYAGENTIVLALPRGGVPVAYEIALALGAPLDVSVVRKLGVPGREELAFGAITSGGGRVLNADVVEILKLSDKLIEAATAREREELERRERLYRGERPPVDLAEKTVILVDDGLATGASMRAAVAAARAQLPARIVVAVPTAATDTCARLREDSRVNELVCPLVADNFLAVSLWYDNFEQLSDAEVRALLARAWEAETR
jgi:predicted phosphoribosyltransferase